MLQGVNLMSAGRIARVAKVKVTASGGVSALKDIESLKSLNKCGVDSVIVGKALYEGRFTLEDALKVAEADD
jgi:phosphoribosylformimino-5-aminoimidazole carboxamide ribotide isomerase